jgi:hypothetical protein
MFLSIVCHPAEPSLPGEIRLVLVFEKGQLGGVFTAWRDAALMASPSGENLRQLRILLLLRQKISPKPVPSQYFGKFGRIRFRKEIRGQNAEIVDRFSPCQSTESNYPELPSLFLRGNGLRKLILQKRTFAKDEAHARRKIRATLRPEVLCLPRRL